MGKVSKTHIEAGLPAGTLFGIGVALCGRRRPTDYRMFPPNDEVHQRANRMFFAYRPKSATCQKCRSIAFRPEGAT